jgi:hypothetical protein
MGAREYDEPDVERRHVFASVEFCNSHHRHWYRCARAANGHAVAPPSSVMNSRLFTARYLPCFCQKNNTRLRRHETAARTPASAGSMPRPVEFRNRVEVVDPRLLRANKYLSARHQLISLAQRSKPHIVGFWLIISRGCIERRPALGAKTLQTDVSAIGGLSIFGRLAGQEHERAWTSDN